MKLNDSDLKTLSEQAITAAKAAGKYIQSQFEANYEKRRKVGGDSLASQVVTEVDLKAQEIILTHLEASIQAFDLGLLTEEATDDQSRMTKDYFWCIDPMDGTLPFTERRTGYAVSIALITKPGDPVVGVVYIPDLEQCYSAIKGEGVKNNGQPLERDEHLAVSKLCIYMDKSFNTEPYAAFVLEKLKEFEGQETCELSLYTSFGGVRNAVSVLSSEIGCYFKFPKKAKGCGSIWDYAATRLFFEETGLQVSNAQGDPLHLNDPDTTFMNEQGVIYATDQELAAFVVRLWEDFLIGQRKD